MEKISLKWLKENKPGFLKEIESHKGSIDKFAPYGKYEYGDSGISRCIMYWHV